MGWSKMHGWKTRNWKTRDRTEGVESAGKGWNGQPNDILTVVVQVQPIGCK